MFRTNYPRKYFTKVFYPAFSSLLLLLALLGLRLDVASSQNYNLVFDSKYSPPAVIPTDAKKLVYTAPLGQLISRPIIIYIQNKMGETMTSLNENIKVYATSMDKSQNNPAGSDTWRDSGGMFCQWRNPDETWPINFHRQLYTTVCGSSLRTTTLIFKVIKGKIIMDWLMHVHSNGTLPPDDRFIRIEIPDLQLTNDTNLFTVTEPAASLHITKQPPNNITANTKFEITAEIRNSKGVPLTAGLDSVAYVELTVSYEYKTFHQRKNKNMVLGSSGFRLGGPFVTVNKATGDLIIRQRAVAGKVTFTDVRILDVVFQVRLNLTMFMSKAPFLRIPNCAECYSDISYKSTSTNNIIQYNVPPASVMKNIPSIALTQMFEVSPQIFAGLKYINPLSAKGKITVTRNFPIPGPITIEIEDANGNRIYSGRDSIVLLSVQTEPRFICLSSDHSAISHEGIAKFTGSICDIKNNVKIIFYSNKLPTVDTTSQPFDVVGDLHIAHFDHFLYTGGGYYISPHINSFIRFAATDVNSGKILSALPAFNITLNVHSIETKNDLRKTGLQYKLVREDGLPQPTQTIHAAILSGNSKINSALAKNFFLEETTIISLDYKEEIFPDFSLFNRVCWSSKQIFHSFLNFCKERYWIRMIILKTSNTYISYSLFRLARQMDMHFEHVVIDDEKVQWKSKDPSSEALRQAMQSVKDLKYKVIICFANHIQMPGILYVANKEQISPMYGYQWIFVSENAWAFPFKNTLACDIPPVCSLTFKGSILFTETYNTSFLHTDNWERVLNYYYTVDKSIYFGLKTVYPDAGKSGRFALAYDAVRLFSEALTNIISNRFTASNKKLVEEMKRITIDGLSGTLKLNQYGDREGFEANIRIISGKVAEGTIDEIAPLQRYIKAIDKKNIEYVYNDKKLPPSNETILSTVLPVSAVYNTRTFVSKSGRVSPIDFQLVKYYNEPWPPENIIRKEKTIVAFKCGHPCGVKLSKDNLNEYDTGICISTNQCRCKPGYFGIYCRKKRCKCLHGLCKVPNECTCFKGYTGDKCDIPICSDNCVNGKCIEPDKCRCYADYWVGYRCHIHLAAILVPFLIFLILLMYICYILFIFFRRRIARIIALSNLDWLVDWQEVSQLDRSSTSIKSMAVASSIGNMTNTLHTWKKRRWFLKKINSYTVEQDDERVRMEMVDLISISHQNLITYGGACLSHPNVCFLVEPAQKGSLEDILLNEMVQLDWNFRFSFMKDICRGMNYLHTKTKIGSHGRLKSSNCLLDNRWCIRITDFGAPTIRYGPYLIQKSETEKANEYYAIQESMLWTAPELLEKATCLDDVRMGTKEGDVYSFGIVVSEIVTRDVPFAYERSVLSTCTLLDLIVNIHSEGLENELESLKSIGSRSDIVRPHILPEHLPTGESEKNKFLKMLDVAWDNDPLARITFQKLTHILDNIFPTKEELMENLMHLLESYSKNLEYMIIEKTDVLDAERNKVDCIMSQMLPPKIIEKLKVGEKVEPKYFECVTVYFSDIVGFTTVTKNSQPMQVVNLLNDLYILFDSILAKYDVYKVETIGDAYIVSSGVPTLNGRLHAGEIATASLDMISAIMTKETSHSLRIKLQLRIGINTGPVVAGVVGLKMPRYTLLGETMQIAAGLESSSKPMRIQISGYTANILQELEGYSVRPNEKKKVCGKSIETFWLIGKRGYQNPLPEYIEE